VEDEDDSEVEDEEEVEEEQTFTVKAAGEEKKLPLMNLRNPINWALIYKETQE